MTVDAWDATALLCKAATYAATLAAAGAVFFAYWCGSLMAVPQSDQVRRLISWLGAMGLGLSILRLPVLMGSMSGELSGMYDAGLARMVLQGREGLSVFVRVLGLIVLLLSRRAAGRVRHVTAAGAVMACTSFAWVGHAHATSRAGWAVGFEAVHLTGVAFWLGSLMPLVWVLGDADRRRAAAVVHRFGLAAFWSVFVLIGAGSGLLALLLPAPSDLWMSAYGRFVTIKLVLVGAMLGLAAHNKWRLSPRLGRADVSTGERLRRSIRMEIALAAAVLIVTATFTTLTGPG